MAQYIFCEVTCSLFGQKKEFVREKIQFLADSGVKMHLFMFCYLWDFFPIHFLSTVYFQSQLTFTWFGPIRKSVKYHGVLRENGY